MNESFSFQNENTREIVIKDGLILCIERIGFAIARVYFVNNCYCEISIPNGLVIRDIINNVLVRPLPKTQSYALARTDSYRITLKGNLNIDLATQRQWSMLCD
jgi:hypothetical protein